MITKTAQNFLSRAHEFMKQPVTLPNTAAKAQRVAMIRTLNELAAQMAKRKQGYSGFKETLEYPVKPAGRLFNQSKDIRARLLAQKDLLGKAERNIEPRSYVRQMHNLRQRLGKVDRFDKAFEDRRLYEVLKNQAARIEADMPGIDQRIKDGKRFGTRYLWGGGLVGSGLGVYGAKKLLSDNDPRRV